MKVNNKHCLSNGKCHSDSDEEVLRDMCCKVGQTLQPYFSSWIGRMLFRRSIVMVKNILAHNDRRKHIADIFEFESSPDPNQHLDVDPKVIEEAKELVKEATKYWEDGTDAQIKDAALRSIDEALVYSALKRRGNGKLSLDATEIQAVNAFGQQQAKSIRRKWKTMKETGPKLYWSTKRRKELTVLFYKYFDMMVAATEDYNNLMKVKGINSQSKTIKEKYPELPEVFVEALESNKKILGLAIFILKYLAPKFDHSSPEYMIKQIIKRPKKGD